MYRPVMGVAGGHREMCSNLSLQEGRQVAERYKRQEGLNPITGQPLGGGSGGGGGGGGGYEAAAPGRPPSGNLGRGLLPSKGPLDHMTGDRDVPQKRVDPSKNQAPNFLLGAVGLAVPPVQAPRAISRITEGGLCEGMGVREPTPERRRTPGQVVRGGLRPKDNLTGGCLTADKQDHPLALPRKAGSRGPGVGSGGSCHLVVGENGLMPRGPEDVYGEAFLAEDTYPLQVGETRFQRACGIVAVGGQR